MKKYLLLILLLTATLLSAETRVKITGNGVRLRTSPYIQNNNIYCMKNSGTTLEYSRTMGDWYEVIYQGQYLYVSRDFASLYNTSSNSGSVSTRSQSYTTVVVNSGVKHLLVRTGPSTSYDYFYWVETGQPVHLSSGTYLTYLSEHVNGFYHVQYKGRSCWISDKYSHLQ